MNDQERLRKYELRNIAQCDRIVILEAQNKQQAEKISNMEIWEKKYLEHIDSLVATNKKYELRHAEQRNRIAELEKQSEPVAWMNPTGLEYKQKASDFMYNDAFYDKKLGWIPLYTTPQTKPLSDEEILKCWYEYGQMLTIEQIRIAFGRAIEAKVRGEK